MRSNLFRTVCRSGIFVLGLAAAAVPAAQAQGRFGGSFKAALSPAPIPMQPAATPGPPAMPALTLALLGPAAQGAATTTNLFAQVAIGGGYTTVFSFVNTGADTTNGNLVLTSDAGAPLRANLSTAGAPATVGSTFAISVPTGGSQVITAGPVNASDPTTTGWASVVGSGGNLGGVATFQFVVGSALQTIVGVLSGNAVSAATVPLNDDHTQNRDTGYAIANTGSTNINIKLVLVNRDGSVFLTDNPPLFNPLAPGKHGAIFVWQELNNTNFQFQGSMVLIEQTSQSFSVVALVLNNGLFTAIPVIPGKPPGIN